MNDLRRFLEINKIPIGDFAKKLGATQPQLSKWLNGMGRPNLDYALKIQDLTLNTVKVQAWAIEKYSQEKQEINTETPLL